MVARGRDPWASRVYFVWPSSTRARGVLVLGTFQVLLEGHGRGQVDMQVEAMSRCVLDAGARAEAT